MKKITLELTEDEYQSIIKFLEKIRNEEQKKRRKSRWIRQDGFMIDPKTGRKYDIQQNRFI